MLHMSDLYVRGRSPSRRRAITGAGETFPTIFLFPSDLRTLQFARPDKVSASTAMAALHSIPRFLLPRQPLLRPSRFTQSLLPTAAVRHVSSPRQLSAEFERRRAAAASTKQKVMPQPDTYRPPSHGKTIRRSDPGLGKVYGPKLSEEDRKRMAMKKYPNMMSPEGTFSHWFLNNRVIHLWITMVRLPYNAISVDARWDGIR